MKASDLSKLLNNFLADNKFGMAILINGNWGIGKTHEATQFLSEIKKDKTCCVQYCSLFGFTDIESLHKQLYFKFHSVKARSAKLLNYIPLAVNLSAPYGLGTGIDISGIKEEIKSKQSSKSIKVKNKNCMVVFDDLERIADYRNKMLEILGYFNRLRLDGIKVAVLCNEDAIKDEGKIVFDKFKEKVFDRIYSIEECNSSVLEEHFGDNYKLLTDAALKLINNNLRTAFKINAFYKDAKDLVIKSGAEIDDVNLMLVCACIVVECFNKTLSDDYAEYLDKTIKENDNEKFLNYHYIAEQKKLGTEEFITNSICHYVKNEIFVTGDKVIQALYRYFVYMDESLLVVKEQKGPVFEERKMFYLADAQRGQYLKDKMKLLLSNDYSFENSNIVHEIESWFQYFSEGIDEETKDTLADRVIAISKTKFNENILSVFNSSAGFSESQDYKDFCKLIMKKDKDNLEEELVRKFNETVKDISKYNGQLSIIGHDMTNKNIKVPQAIVSSLTGNNFYLPDLSGEINVAVWDFCHSLCRFVVRFVPDKKEDLRKYLLSLKENNPKCKCLAERVDSLIKYRIDENA